MTIVEHRSSRPEQLLSEVFPVQKSRRGFLRLLPIFLVIVLAAQVHGQEVPVDQSPEDARINAMAEEAKKKEARAKPPFEIFRSQIAPFDVLPFVKPNHWSTLSLELRANQADYAGSLQTAPVTLRGQPHAITFRRDARLVKEQRSRLSMPIFLPQIPKELGLELVRPDQIRADEATYANLRVLEPHQMLVVVLSKKANDSYAKWNNLRALIPATGVNDVVAIEKLRYYRLVLPLDPEKPFLSPHPLTWSTISHVIWDGLEPDVLSPAQQSAMLDWLHWGGQLILVGGAGPTFAPLRESFLGPYLPADLSGTNYQLTADDFKPLSQAYPPLTKMPDPDEPQPEVASIKEAYDQFGRRYAAPVPILPASNRPVFLSGLEPKPGSVSIPFGSGGDGRVIGVEGRVGRGRVLMLGLNPTDPAFTAWPGLDTFVRRVLLRRPEEVMVRAITRRDGGVDPPRYQMLGATELSWVRYLSRDLEAVEGVGPKPMASPIPTTTPPVVARTSGKRSNTPRLPGMSSQMNASDEYEPPSPFLNRPVGEWLDDAALPRLCRDLLEEASGLSIPSSTFVLKVILAYLVTLVPLNWLVCRYVFGKKEWAWVVVPVISLIFAIGVERAASFDLGFEAACDEIDILELQSDYPRGHLSRFGSIYSSSRVQFSISYPDEPTALTLPFDSGRSLRGEDVTESIFQTQPTPSLRQFRVQPRSYSMFRAEQMYNIEGPIRWIQAESGRSIINESEIDLHDAVLIDGSERSVAIGDILKGTTVNIPLTTAENETPPTANGPLKPDQLIRLIQLQKLDRPEQKGLLRLVAWSPDPRGGRQIEPATERQRGFTLVVVDLKHGMPPSPDGPQFDALALDADLTPSPDAPPNAINSEIPAKTRQFQVR